MEVKQHETRDITIDRFSNGRSITEFTVSTQGLLKMKTMDAGFFTGHWVSSATATLTPDELDALSAALKWAADTMRQNASNAKGTQ